MKMGRRFGIRFVSHPSGSAKAGRESPRCVGAQVLVKYRPAWAGAGGKESQARC